MENNHPLLTSLRTTTVVTIQAEEVVVVVDIVVAVVLAVVEVAGAIAIEEVVGEMAIMTHRMETDLGVVIEEALHSEAAENEIGNVIVMIGAVEEVEILPLQVILAMIDGRRSPKVPRLAGPHFSPEMSVLNLNYLAMLILVLTLISMRIYLLKLLVSKCHPKFKHSTIYR